MKQEQRALLRTLPAVDALLRRPPLAGAAVTGETATLIAREVVAGLRQRVAAGEICNADALSHAEAVALREVAELLGRPRLRPVWNGTGVLIHTNAGRAPLSTAALAAITATAAGYSNLELDLERGARGSRQDLLRPLLRWLGRAEDALVVNNGAAALMLALHALAPGQPVLVSRGELVEIGGSFRVPDVMRAAGVRLVEVGTTNRTHARDYADAAAALAQAGERVGALLQIHRSNFDQVGFVATPAIAELAAIARQFQAPLIADLGSGATGPLAPHGLRDEPEIAATLAAGADLVTASGDKLLGGPQAGLLLGRTDLVARCGKAPMARALRPCRLTLAALEPTLRAHLAGEASEVLPLWRAIDRSLDALNALGERLCDVVAAGPDLGLATELRDAEAAVGGGAQAGGALPSVALALRMRGRSGTGLEQRLRKLDPPWLGRARGDEVWLDLRSLGCGADDDAVVDAFGVALVQLGSATKAATAA